MRLLPLFFALLLGCSGSNDVDPPGDDTDTDTDLPPSDTDEEQEEDEEDPEPCTATVDAVTPQPGGQAHISTAVTITLSEAITEDDPLSLSLTAPDGPVAGTLALAADGLSASFTPSADLLYETEYEMAVEVCDFTASATFTTFGAPIESPNLEGRTYGMLYEEVQFIQPGNSTLLSNDFDYILVQIDEVDPVAQTFESLATVGFSHPDGMDLVCPAARAPTSDMSINPAFSVGPSDLVYPIAGSILTLQDFTLNGHFSTDGEALVDVHLYGLVETQSAVGLDCALAAFLVQGTCIPCPSGAGECLIIEALAPRADWMSEVDVVGVCGG